MTSGIWATALACLTLTHARPSSFLHTRNTSCPSTSPSSPGPGYEHHTIGSNNSTWSWQIFKSSDLNPPVWEINRTGDPLAPGYIILTTIEDPTHPAAKQPAATIFTDEGQLVWSTEVDGSYFNLEATELFGQNVLVYSAGTNPGDPALQGRTYGNVTILDDTYSTLTTLCPNFNLTIPGNITYDCQADHHESYITDRGTLLVPAVNVTTANLTSVGGPADTCVTNSLIYEIDIQTQEILFSWDAMEHVPFTASRNPQLATSNCSNPIDWFHANSIQNFGENYLLSGRYTDTIFLLAPNGSIIWEFDGQDGGDFTVFPDIETAEFQYQHDARATNFGDDGSFDLSLFNNNMGDTIKTGLPTELLLFRMTPPLNGSNGTATLQRKIVNDPEIFVSSQGGYQPDVEDGHQLGAYGTIPLIKEFSPTGSNETKELFSGRVGPDNQVAIYRGYKQEWHATPWTQPSLVVEANSTTGGYNGFVSWNGATDVTEWNVYVSQGVEEELSMVGSVAFRGFETMFDLPCWANYVQIGAVETGMEVRRSPAVQV